MFTVALAIEMLEITKAFPGVLANDRVSLGVAQGTVHAIVGENGAGKSTLMNILYGLYQPDSGRLRVRGREVTISGPRQAIALGIGMVHQHFMLIPRLTVAENIVLGREPGSALLLDRVAAVARVAELSERYGFRVDPRARVADVSVGMQQRVEILKALYRGADLLILDEPTAVLTPQETQELFGIIRSLAAQGKTIIFITHKLEEVMAVSHQVSVLRQGRHAGTLPTHQTTPIELARMMVGREIHLQGGPRAPMPVGETVLSLHDVRLTRKGTEVLEGISFTVRRGEIFGIAGVDGNGQQELVEAITGLQRPTAGKVKLAQKDISKWSTRQIRAAGVGYIPEDRHKRGLVLDFSVAENLILGEHHRPPYRQGGIWLNLSQISRHAADLAGRFDIRTPGPEVQARKLSGGNQQKVVIARELSRQPDLVIATQPTRGLDIGATEFVHQALVAARNGGQAVLLVSLDLDEIMSLSDRIAVIFKGRLVGIVDADGATREQLGLMMMGSREVAS